MSQVSTRRSRRQTNDDDSVSSKSSTPKPNGIEESPQEKAPKEPTPPPQEEKEVTKEVEVAPEVKTSVTNGHEEESLDVSTKEDVISADEPDPELVFEENSDLESGRDSPVLSRCKTRRSLTRNIPTPKTPKSLEEEAPVEEAEEQEGEELNMTFESCSTSTYVEHSENVSTKAEVGGDSTRLNYTESNSEPNSFLQEVKNKSFGDTLKCLSRRRTIRPISDDYRKRLLQNNLEKQDSGAAYFSRNSVDRVSLVGIKRKTCDEEEEEEQSKRFKDDSPGFFARLTSPLASFRNPFRSDLASSTPKLTGYKDENCLLEEGTVNSKFELECEVKDGERRWCSIM